MPPDEAVAQSAQVLIRHFELLTELVAKPAARFEKAPTSAVQIPAKLYDIPIEDLDLTVRAYNCLKRAGITKVGQVLEMSEDDLLGVRNFGRKSLDELRDRLSERGLLENSRLAATSTSTVGTGEEVEEEGELEEEATTEELMQPSSVAPVAPPPEPPPVLRPAPIQVADDEEIEDFTRSPSARAVRTAPRPPPVPVVEEEEEEEIPEYTYDFSEEDVEGDEEEEEQPRTRGGRRRR
jgi:hypothetical protein